MLTRKLAAGFPFRVPCADYAIAVGQESMGQALKHLLPHLFTLDDLKAGGVAALNKDKVATLIGASLFSFFSLFSLIFFY